MMIVKYQWKNHKNLDITKKEERTIRIGQMD